MKIRTILRHLTPIYVMFIFSTQAVGGGLPLSITVLQTTNGVQKRDGSNDPSDKVTQIISVAEEHFTKGNSHAERKEREAAVKEFDAAVDTVLEGGVDIRSNERLQTYYLQLVERVYRAEQLFGQGASPKASETGFVEQQFISSPLDELSKLVLTEEETSVSPEEVAKLEARLKSVLDFKIEPHPVIQQFIKYHQGRGRTDMELGLRHSSRYLPMMRRIFRREDIPEDLVWLAQVLSQWNVRALSHNGSAGFWQFDPPTGSRFGLRQTPWIDERFSFEKSTLAAAKYLNFLYERYGNKWDLAISAYVAGIDAVDRAIRRAGVLDFWTIYPYLPMETRDYVPNLFATILIATGREGAGFGGIRSIPTVPLAYDVISVPSATSLRLIANLTDTTVEFIRGINPQLTGDTTPPGEQCILNVPPKRGTEVVTLLKRIPIDRRAKDALVISAVPGESFESIARRTQINLMTIRHWNEGIDLKLGGKLVVPKDSDLGREGQCAVGVERAIELRGLRLGMSISEALPDLTKLILETSTSVQQGAFLTEKSFKNEFGLAIIEVRVLPADISRVEQGNAKNIPNTVPADYIMYADPSQSPRYKGVSKVILWFLDDRLASFRIDYDTNIKWDSVNEFVDQVMKSSSLYGTWKAETAYGAGKTLACEGFGITASIDEQTSVPSLTMKELSSWQRLVKRQEEKAKKEERRKKESFVP